MPSFSANRQGRPRPSNISFGRRRSDDKSMPSPSFNSSMFLGSSDDVFCDSSRSVDRLRHHYLAMPSTPSSLCPGSSPGARTERLPSLTDLFDQEILSPPSSNFLSVGSSRSSQAGDQMQRSGSMSSASSGRGRQWRPSFASEGPSGSIGPPATPLSPYFMTASKGPIRSPPGFSSSPPHNSILSGPSDGERTPRAASRSSFDSTTNTSSYARSPRCPGAPLIGVQERGHFATRPWQSGSVVSSLGTFRGVQRSVPNSGLDHSPEPYSDEDRAAMSRIHASLPKAPGLVGLGIFMDEANVQSPFRKMSQSLQTGRAMDQSPPARSQNGHSDHTGLTPMVKASKVSDTSSTPTRSKAKKATGSPATSSAALVKVSPTATALKKQNEPYKTPLNKSRPMFRLDTGSGKKSSKPKGHKMSPDASPWGVFGGKDGWKPLAPPNVSRAIAEANKLLAETTTNASDAAKPSVPRSSPTSKRQATSNAGAESPSKKLRAIDAQSSPFKENLPPSHASLSPSKRGPLSSSSHRTTALPLSTIR